MVIVHSGVQERILDLNPLAVFVLRNKGSLNLVGVPSTHVDVQAIKFWCYGTSVWLLFMLN
jgi:hypothetical protein